MDDIEWVSSVVCFVQDSRIILIPTLKKCIVNMFVNAINVFLGVYAMSSINRKHFSFKERRDYF